jgi:two-component system cell cycle response regulator
MSISRPITAKDTAKIVVADDDEPLLHTLVWILNERGYDVVPVSDGTTLIDCMARERPDLLMLDIMMPRIDGLKLLAQVKQDARWRDLPVLMISSMPPEDGTVKSLGLGASDFIAKPFRVKELVARVETHLRLGKALRDARREAREQAAEASARAEEAAIRAEMVDIFQEVTDALKPEEIYHVLARRVANVLNISKCSLVVAEPGDEVGSIIVASDNPMLRNLEIRLDRYPEIQRALATNRPLFVADVRTDPLYAKARERWSREGVDVPTRSAIVVPFSLHGVQSGVFFLRTLGNAPPLTASDVEFAEQAIKTAVAAIERASQLETARSDKERYRWLATTDSLTGCLNRRALVEGIERELDRNRRYNTDLSVLLIDLDRFKDINDTHGHLAGDSVLRQVGRLLHEELRTVDIAARYGGEEFVIVLPETGLDGALAFADRLRERVGHHDFSDDGTVFQVTVSIGVASVPGNWAATPETLIALADEALYRAKNDGRNLVRS